LVIIAAVATVMLVSNISYLWFETPMRHLFRRKRDTPPASPSANQLTPTGA
jgi:peptidoglycan/LPS O-acetylase OafA/YrhL